MYILALDLSLNSTGYAILKLDDERAPTVIKKGIIKAKAKETHHIKLNRHHRVLSAIKEEYADRDLVVVKEQLLFSPPRTAAILAKVHGVVDMRFPKVHEHYPSTVKKQVTGDGHAKKQEVADGVYKMLGITDKKELPFRTDDESDAVAVGLTHISLHHPYIIE